MPESSLVVITAEQFLHVQHRVITLLQSPQKKEKKQHCGSTGSYEISVKDRTPTARGHFLKREMRATGTTKTTVQIKNHESQSNGCTHRSEMQRDDESKRPCAGNSRWVRVDLREINQEFLEDAERDERENRTNLDDARNPRFDFCVANSRAILGIARLCTP